MLINHNDSKRNNSLTCSKSYESHQFHELQDFFLKHWQWLPHIKTLCRKNSLSRNSFLLLMNGDSIQQSSTFNGNALGGPLLLKGGQQLLLADADHVLLEVKLLGVEAQQPQPELPQRLRVLAQGRETPLLHQGNRLILFWLILHWLQHCSSSNTSPITSLATMKDLVKVRLNHYS